MAANFTGHRHSEESKRKMSLARKGHAPTKGFTGKIIIVMGLTIIFAMVAYSFVMPDHGHFNMETGAIVCNSTISCRHEQGHALDKNMSWVSMTDEWKQSVEIYRLVQWSMAPTYRDDMAKMIYDFPGIGSPYAADSNIVNYTFWHGGWGGYTELYAAIWTFANGDVNNIPSSLRGYYSGDYKNE